MPNTKEKLIEKIDPILKSLPWGEITPNTAEQIADRLIEEGVTFDKDNDVPSKWISVKDRLPIEEAKAHEQEWCEEYCEFLVMIERGLLPTTLYYDWENNEWFRINTAFERETYKITHWMPLPEPPKGE